MNAMGKQQARKTVSPNARIARMTLKRLSRRKKYAAGLKQRNERVSQAEREDNIAIAALVIERKRSLREEDVVSGDEMLEHLGVDPSELR